MQKLKEKKPSLADIATRVGVSQMSVSRTLRGLPKVSEGVRRKVLQAAQEMGYEHDTEISRVMRLMCRSRSDAFFEAIAFIGSRPNTVFPGDHGYIAEMLEGAKKRAKALSCSVDIFHREDFAKNPERLCEILHSRGIRGVVMSPPTSVDDRFALNRHGLIAVGLGYHHRAQVPNVVRFNDFGGMALCCQQLRQRGYRKLALILDHEIDRRADGRLSAAFIAHSEDSFPSSAGHRILLESPIRAKAVLDFVRARQPDAVIASSPVVHTWLREAGIRVPDDMAFATMAYSASQPLIAGVDQHFEEWGAKAMDQLASLLRQPANPADQTPVSLLIEGKWRDGLSVPARTPFGDAA